MVSPNVSLPECATLRKHFWEAFVEQSLRQLLRSNRLLLRIKVQSSIFLAHLFTIKFCATCQKKVSGLASEQGV